MRTGVAVRMPNWVLLRSSVFLIGTPITPNIIQTMKHTVNASVLTISTDHALRLCDLASGKVFAGCRFCAAAVLIVRPSPAPRAVRALLGAPARVPIRLRHEPRRAEGGGPARPEGAGGVVLKT